MNVNQTIKQKKNPFCSFNRFIRFNLYSEDYAVVFYFWLFNFCTWILLRLPETKVKHFICSIIFINACSLFIFFAD